MSASTGTIQQPLSGKGSLFGLAAMVAAALLAAAVAWGALGLTKPHAITTQVPTPITTDQGSRVQNVQVPTPIDTDAGNRVQVRVDYPKFRAS